MDPITSEQQSYSWLQVPKAIWHFVGDHKRAFVSLHTLLFLVLFYDLVPPYILGKIVDFFTNYERGDSLNTFYYLVLFLGASSIIIAIIRLTTKDKLSRLAITAQTNARIEGFERLMDFSLAWHSKENSGNKVQRIFTGSEAISEWSNLINNGIFPIATAFLGVLGVFLFLNPLFLVFVLIYAALFFTIEYIFNRKLERLSNEINKLKEKSSGAYIEGAGNILAIKALGAEKSLHTQVRLHEEASQKLQFASNSAGTQKYYWFQSLNGVGLVVFLFLIAQDILTGAITVGYILIFISYFDRLRNAADHIINVSGKVVQLKSDLLRMMPIFLETAGVKTGTEPFPKHWRDIRIENGSFKYPSGQVGMKDLNFVLNRDEKLGVAGLSGSGKSTMIKILLGLYELESGTFKVGNKNYYDIAHEEITKHIAVVLQETELFNLSLRDNITVMRNVSPALLATAIDTAQLSDVIAKLPEGLDTFIGERGYSLSGGERQRLGIARAICKDAPVLIFDEATSSLDSKTEQVIMQKLLENLSQKTLLIIAHRLSTLKDTDRIIVFEQGQIIEDGTFDSLQNKPDSKFGELYQLQHHQS
jgi:ABC-type multidrug transport system fused ATPase/permease subunit